MRIVPQKPKARLVDGRVRQDSVPTQGETLISNLVICRKPTVACNQIRSPRSILFVLLQKAVSTKDRVLAAKAMVDAYIGRVHLRWRVVDVIVVRRTVPYRHRWIVRIREQRSQLDADRIEARWVNNERRGRRRGRQAAALSGCNAVQGIRGGVQFTEVARLHLCRRHHGRLCYILSATKALVVCEEKCMVPVYRPTDRAAKLILAEHALRQTLLAVVVGVGVQHTIADELPGISMEAVRTTLRRSVDHRPSRRTKLYRVGPCL